MKPDLNPELLNTSELLALSLLERQNSPMVKELSVRYGCPLELYQATVEELQQITGIGPAKATQIKAILELGKRLLSTPVETRPVIKSPSDVADLLLNELKLLDREHFKAIYLNTKHHVISIETISIGNLNSSLVHPRELFKTAIKRSAGAIIAVHNHPSGSPEPSAEDVEITRRLVEVGNLIGIQVLDHIIIGNGNWVSLKEQGVI